MAYTPDNNPYIPGDPYSYDLKWQVDNIKHMQTRFEELDENIQEATDQADRAQQEADRAAGRADFATTEADRATQQANNAAASAEAAAESEAAAKDYADNIADPVSGLVSDWLTLHVSPETGYVIDKSLTISNAAADAKNVGNSLLALNNNVSRKITIGSSFAGLYTVSGSGSLAPSTTRAASGNLEYHFGDVIRCDDNSIKFKVVVLNDDMNTYSYLFDEWVTSYKINSAGIYRILAANADESTIADGQSIIDKISIDYQLFNWPLLSTRWGLTGNNKLYFERRNSWANIMIFAPLVNKGDTIVTGSYVFYTSIIDSNGYRIQGSIANPLQNITTDGIVIAQLQDTNISAWTNKHVIDVLSSMRILKANSQMPFVYSEQPIKISNYHGATAEYLFAVPRYSDKGLQALAISGGTIFQMYHGGFCNVFDNSGNLLGSYQMPGMTDDDHCGNASFSANYFADNAVYPALYLSGNLATFECKVMSVTNTAATLKQVIDFSALTYENMNGSAVCIDEYNNKIYYIQRTGSYGNNILYISEIALPDLTAGTLVDGVLHVTISAADVIRSFTTSEAVIKYQDAAINNGKLYVIGGHTPTTINVFDLATGQRLSYANISSVADYMEPEGIGIWNGAVYISFFYGYIKRFIFS